MPVFLYGKFGRRLFMLCLVVGLLMWGKNAPNVGWVCLTLAGLGYWTYRVIQKRHNEKFLKEWERKYGKPGDRK